MVVEENMTLNEAKEILTENGMELIKEGSKYSQKKITIMLTSDVTPRDAKTMVEDIESKFPSLNVTVNGNRREIVISKQDSDFAYFNAVLSRLEVYFAYNKSFIRRMTITADY